MIPGGGPDSLDVLLGDLDRACPQGPKTRLFQDLVEPFALLIFEQRKPERKHGAQSDHHFVRHRPLAT